jgi:hypothetical protein
MKLAQRMMLVPVPPCPGLPAVGFPRHPFALITASLVLLLSGSSALAAPPAPAAARSLVTLEVTRNQYDYVQPWSKRSETYQKTGVVVGPRLVLTTADQLADRTLIRLQKGGRGAWYGGEVEWIDYHANLALLTTTNAEFWTGLKPVQFSRRLPTRGSAQVLRWREGRFESRKAEVNRVTVKRGKLTILDHLHLELDCDLKAAGWAEAVVAGGQWVGITVSQDGTTCTVLPGPLIRAVLDARRQGSYRGLGFFAFVWQRAENPAIHRWLKLPGPPRGVLVVETPSLGGNEGVLQPRDLILQINGFAIDTQGDYQDPEYGELMLENLSTRGLWAGDKVHLRVWREGREAEVDYTLPAADFNVDLVPQAVYDQPPEYLVLGGLVFQPLTEPFLRSWGPEWRRRVPFRLGYYDREKPTPDRPSRVLLSLVLPDPFNLGYQEARYLVLDTLNSQRISRISDILQALASPPDGFHILEFERGDSIRRLVLEAAEVEAATQRVLERYGIQSAAVVSARP